MLIMVPLGGAATDNYMPSLPAMEHYFHADRFAVRTTLLFFAGVLCKEFGFVVK